MICIFFLLVQVKKKMDTTKILSQLANGPLSVTTACLLYRLFVQSGILPADGCTLKPLNTKRVNLIKITELEAQYIEAKFFTLVATHGNNDLFKLISGFINPKTRTAEIPLYEPWVQLCPSGIVKKLSVSSTAFSSTNPDDQPSNDDIVKVLATVALTLGSVGDNDVLIFMVDVDHERKPVSSVVLLIRARVVLFEQRNVMFDYNNLAHQNTHIIIITTSV